MKINQLVAKMIDQELSELHVALPAKIEKYDPKKMIAEVTLLAKKKLGDEEKIIPPVLKVPVAHLNAGPFIIRPPYEKEDKVQVLFNERALDKLLITGEPESVEYKRKHSFDDAVVIKGLKTEQEANLPREETDSLYLANTDTNSRVFIRKNGDIIANNETSQAEMIKDGDIKINTSNNITINCTNATVNASNTTVNGTVDLAGGGSPVARVGDEIETYVSGGSSAGTHKGKIISGSGKTTSG